VAKTSGKVRWARVDKARTRIERGFYDDPAVFDKILPPRRLDRILTDLNKCPVGDGDQYRDLVAETVSGCLSDVVDVPLSRREFKAAGGRGDIELPLKIEALNDLPLWGRWANKYDMRSILLESKNEKGQASVEDVSQLAGYLNQVGVGHFGLLVARKGFSRNAIKNLSSVAKGNLNLIIPLDHDQLGELVKASKDGSRATMEYLRRRETLLLQAA
jgi:hypothetical protein